MAHEYRCTRSMLYRDSPGNTQSRQGHYIVAVSAEHATDIMSKRYPEDVTIAAYLGDQPFTVDVWRRDVLQGWTREDLHIVDVVVDPLDRSQPDQ